MPASGNAGGIFYFREVQGKGLGGLLMLNALERVAEISRQAGIAAVVLDAKDEAVARFYRRFGFIALPDKPLQLFLPTETVCEVFAQLAGLPR